mmetsp:Transcript_24736/g.50097  ORF Transcript_24736/g.50097 Transcript_24736/m.50097 type:complete len:148 (-) Transcript_24736:14-457(-)
MAIQIHIDTVYKLTKPGDIAVLRLCKALEDRDKNVRVWAANGLGRFGPASADAVDKLRKVLKDRADQVASTCAQAFRPSCRIGRFARLGGLGSEVEPAQASTSATVREGRNSGLEVDSVVASMTELVRRCVMPYHLTTKKKKKKKKY